LADDGQVLWRAQAPGPIYDLATLEGDRVATGDDAGLVTLFDGRGRQLWQHSLGSRVTVLNSDWPGRLLAGGWDERLTLLDEGGDVLWQVELDGPVAGIAVLPPAGGETAGVPDAAGLIVAATVEGRLTAFDTAGTEMWRSDVGATLFRLGTMGEGLDTSLLAGTQDGRLLSLDPAGTLRWQRALGEGSPGSPVWQVADVTGDGVPEIVAGLGGGAPALVLLANGGEVLWRLASPAPVAAVTSLDLDGDGTIEILAGLSSGEIRAYDAQGRLRGQVHAGLPVSGLRVAGVGSTTSSGEPASTTAAGSVWVLADVVAWKARAGDGSTGGPWLSPPKMVPGPPESLPPAVRRAEDEAILAFLGDVAPGRSMEAQLARYGPQVPWAGLEPLLREADLAIANLECVLTTRGEPLKKTYLIRAHPRWGETLTAGGLDLLSVANNHALDYGPAGLNETLDTLQALGIAAVGAGRSQEDAQRPALFTVNGVRVAVLGYAAARWDGSVDVPATDRLAWARPATVQAGVGAVRDQVDIVVVLLHAGTEYAAEPSPDQVAVAHAAIDAGADLVVGHHPHVTQTVERYGGGLVVYSLGDALFDIPRPAAMQGDLLRVHVTREGLTQAELWPFWIEDAIRPRLLDDGQGAPEVEIVYP